MACPFRCVYCNQYNITAREKPPAAEDVREIIESYLLTLPQTDASIETAFFGGSFTGLSIPEQNKYLDILQPFIKSERISGIRISTRPDYINSEILANLKQRCVKSIELGAQSMDDKVLKKAGRGHSAKDVSRAAELIKKMGFELGLQMMTGLPGDTEEKAMKTAQEIISLGADTTRIYPTLVIKDTPLASLYQKKEYQPQHLSEAVSLTAKLYYLFNRAGVRVLRMGLHPSEGFLTGERLVAGPFHVAFGELVLTRLWEEKLRSITKETEHQSVTLFVHPSDLNASIGHKATNKKRLKYFYSKVRFVADNNVAKGTFHADFT